MVGTCGSVCQAVTERAAHNGYRTRSHSYTQRIHIKDESAMESPDSDRRKLQVSNRACACVTLHLLRRQHVNTHVHSYIISV